MDYRTDKPVGGVTLLPNGLKLTFENGEVVRFPGSFFHHMFDMDTLLKQPGEKGLNDIKARVESGEWSGQVQSQDLVNQVLDNLPADHGYEDEDIAWMRVGQ